MADVETLLPPNRQPAEEALEQAIARAAGVSVPLRALARPYAASTAFLPWIAWGLSVDLWRTEWPEERKRVAVATSLTWHARKGTRAAIRHGLEMSGARVRRFVTPPSKTFAAPRLTAEERDRFLSMFAQVRVYPYVRRAPAGRHFARFASGPSGAPSAFAGPIAAVGANGRRWTRRATLWDDGTETDLTVREFRLERVGTFGATAYDEVVIPARKTRSLHAGGPPRARSFLVDDQGVRRRIVRVARDVDYSYRLGREIRTTVWPDERLVDVRPEIVAEPHTATHGAMFGMGFCGCGRREGVTLHRVFLPPSRAWRYLYERWYLHDPERVPEARRRSTHAGYARLGMPPHTAEVRVSITGRRSRWTLGRFVYGFPVAQPGDGIRDARQAVAASKSLRDKVLLDTRNWRPPRVGDRVGLGDDVKIGQLIEV